MDNAETKAHVRYSMFSFTEAKVKMVKSKVKKTHLFNAAINSVSYLPRGPRSPESWLPASLGVLTDFEEGDIGVGTK